VKGANELFTCHREERSDVAIHHFFLKVRWIATPRAWLAMTNERVNAPD